MSHRTREVRFPNGLAVHAANTFEANVLYHEMFVARSYLRHGIALRAGDLVFDVGANIGMCGAFLASEVPGLVLHMFEPVPTTFSILERNAAALRDRATVHLHSVALGCEACRADIWTDPSASFSATMRPQVVEASLDRSATPHDWAEAVLIDFSRVFPGSTMGRLGSAALRNRFARPLALRLASLGLVLDGHSRRRRTLHATCDVLRLSDVVKAHAIETIHLLKIDVEGAEMDVLEGIDEADWPRVKQLVIEVHDADGRAEGIMAMLERRGYAVVAEPEDWAIHRLLGLTTVFARRN